MNPITSIIKRYPQAAFWLIAWSTFAFGWFMFKKDGSLLWAFLIWGPFLGGALVTAIADGRRGLRTFFGRIVRWRVGIQWYAIALLLPPLFKLLAAGLNIMISGAEFPATIHWLSQSDLLISIIMAVFFISLGEEPGFRGFALPRYLTQYPALSASLIVGVLHAIWHIPLFITGDDAPVTTAAIIISGSVLFTWLFNRTNGSVLIAILLHSSVDISTDFFRPFFAGVDARSYETWYIALYVVLAVLLLVINGKELGRKPQTTMEATPAHQKLAAH
jgi:uncharacterized protein